MYDPIPDLAALLDGMQETGRSGGSHAVIGQMLTGPYARLRGGLLLDEPGRETVTTEQAIREALGQPVMPQVPDSTFAWIAGAGSTGVTRDLPVISAATAVMSYHKLVSHYQRIWPEERTRAARRRLLELAGNLPEAEREKMPAWLLRVVRSGHQEGA